MVTSGLTDTWDQIRAALQGMLPEASFNTWFTNAHLEAHENQKLVIGAANRFVKAWLENNYLGLITQAAHSVLGFAPEVSVVISREQYKKHLETTSANSAKTEDAGILVPPANGVNSEQLRREVMGDRLPLFEKSPNNFENFVSGRCNYFALAAARQAVDAPGSFSPLFIFGGHGLGKTHLLHAICRAASQQDRALKIICLTADAFVQAFTSAYVEHRIHDFRLRFERCDLLAIDDFQNFAAGKKAASQKELASILDHLCHRGRQVVLASDRVGHELAGLDPMLASRLSAGLQVRLEPLDAATRYALISRKGENFSPELTAYLASRAGGSVREIEGVVKTLAAMSKLSGQAIDCDQAAQLLAPKAEVVPALPEIAAAVAASFGVPVAELRGKKRQGSVIDARRVAVRLARLLGGASLSEIGEYFGGRTHSTILAILRTAPGSSSGVFLEKFQAVLDRLGCRRDCTEFLAEQTTIFTPATEITSDCADRPDSGAE